MGSGDDRATWGIDASVSASDAGRKDSLSDEEQDPFRRSLDEAPHGGQLLGQGAMGRVIAVEDPRLGRELALKELLPRGQRAATAKARFLREMRITARLDHPGIVPVMYAGRRADGTLFYTMRRIRGRTLRDVLAARPELPERLRLVDRLIDVCQAVAYAHSRGVVHRDLKPDNVMLGEFGETLVMDWGLARAGEEAEPAAEGAGEGSALETRVGTILGTPAYMSPEQARGDVGAVDARSDVWSLGVMLHELLTGRLPFGDDDPRAIIARVVVAGPLDVAALPPDVPRSVAAVAAKALDPAPSRRYAGAAELAADLEAWRDGLRVSAHTYSLSEELRRRLAPYAAVIAVAGGAALALLVVSGLGVYNVVRERDRAERQLAETFLQKARATADDRPVEAALYAARALAELDAPEARGVLARSATAWRPTLLGAREMAGGCSALVTRGDLRVCAGDETVTAWLAGAAEPLWTAAGHRAIFADDGTVHVLREPLGWSRLDARTGQPVADDEHHSLGSFVRLADGGWFEYGTTSGIGRGPDGARRWEGEWGSAVSGVVTSADGADLFVSWLGGEVARLSAADGALKWKGKPPSLAGGATGLALSPDGATLAVGSMDHQVLLLDPTDGTERSVHLWHQGAVDRLAWSPDGRWLVTASDIGTVALAGPDGTLVARLSHHRARVLQFDPVSGALLVDGSDGKLRAWSLADPASREVLMPAGIGSLELSPDARSAVVFDGAGNGARFDVGTGEVAWRRRISEVVTKDSAWLADGTLFVASATHSWKRLRAEDGEQLADVDQEPLRALAPSGGDLVALDYDEQVQILDVSGSSRVVPGAPSGGVVGLGRGQDGRSFVLLREDGALLVFASAAEGAPRELPSPSTTAVRAAVGAQGLVAAADSAGTVFLQRGGAWEELGRHAATVDELRFSPSGALLATGSRDHTVRIWDVASGALVAVLEGHQHRVGRVRWADDGTLVTAGWDRRALVWDLSVLDEPPEQLAAALTARTGLRLDGTEVRFVDAAAGTPP